MSDPQAEQSSYQATQEETAASRRRFRGRVLAWLALAMWLAGVLGAYGATGRAQPASESVLAGTTPAATVAYVSLACAGLVGLVLAIVAVRQARRDGLAWAVLALDAITGGGALLLLLLRR